jgi:translation initiation factor 3 subunit F
VRSAASANATVFAISEQYISFVHSFSRAPNGVILHPSALFGILDHYLRRTDAQARVIGTLLGTRAADGAGGIEVTGAFAVLHSETEELVAVDKEYHRGMLELAQRVNPREVIVGWCVQEHPTICTYQRVQC